MADTPVRKAEDIDWDLRALILDVGDLAEVLRESSAGEGFEELSEAEQDIWLYGWPNDRAILEDVFEPAYRAGEMNAEQERLYEELKATLRELAPEIERVMELRVPPEVLEG